MVLALGRPADAGWTGFHAGLYGGGGWGDAPATSTTTANSNAAANYPPFTATGIGAVNSAGTQDLHPSGGAFGAQLGYDHQFGQILLGFEVDGGLFSTSATNAVPARYPDILNGFTLTQTVSTDWLATARPRVGWATPQILYYLTAGVAATDFKYSAQFTDNFANSHGLGTAFESSSASKHAVGWTAGIGIEVQLMGKLAVKAEYLHADFGSLSSSGTLSVNGGQFVNVFAHNVSLSEDMLRIGINRRF